MFYKNKVKIMCVCAEGSSSTTVLGHLPESLPWASGPC